MGGQACVLYGAAEFSRDADFAILIEPGNMDRLRRALRDLDAKNVAVPPFEMGYLERGHAVHFRCRHPEAEGMRVDLMAKMRGVDNFMELWERRTTMQLEDGLEVDLLALPDLVRTKKTQRDKDWPKIRRLLEASYFNHREKPSAEQVRFWFEELRTPELLLEAAKRFPDEARSGAESRAPLAVAIETGKAEAEDDALVQEERVERALDASHWEPLRAELAPASE